MYVKCMFNCFIPLAIGGCPTLPLRGPSINNVRYFEGDEGGIPIDELENKQCIRKDKN